MWDLLRAYEQDLRLLEPLDSFSALGQNDEYEEDVVIAVIETEGMVHEHDGRLVIRAKRQIPQTLQVNVNVPIQVPANLDQQQLTPALQQMLQQAQQEISQAAQQAVQEALRAQAPDGGP
jgi:hypothetical protein